MIEWIERQFNDWTSIHSSPSTIALSKRVNRETFSEKWHSYFSSTLEQSVRVKDAGESTSIEFGIGESLRNMDQMFDTIEIGDQARISESKNVVKFYERSIIPWQTETKIENIKSETIFVVSNDGVPAAIQKWGRLMQVFGNLVNTDCPCSVCSNKRPNNINSMTYNKYLGKKFVKFSLINLQEKMQF